MGFAGDFKSRLIKCDPHNSVFK